MDTSQKNDTVNLPHMTSLALFLSIVFSNSELMSFCLLNGLFQGESKAKGGGHLPSAGAGKISSSNLESFWTEKLSQKWMMMVFAMRARVRRQERVGGRLRSYLGLVVIKRVRSRQDIESVQAVGVSGARKVEGLGVEMKA